MEEIARSVVDLLIPIVESIGALVIGIGVLITFAAYVLRRREGVDARQAVIAACSWRQPATSPTVAAFASATAELRANWRRA